MKDWYSRLVFTVIAIALSVIAVKMPIGSAYALGGEACGNILNPCYVAASGRSGLDVNVTNMR